MDHVRGSNLWCGKQMFQSLSPFYCRKTDESTSRNLGIHSSMLILFFLLAFEGSKELGDHPYLPIPSQSSGSVFPWVGAEILHDQRSPGMELLATDWRDTGMDRSCHRGWGPGEVTGPQDLSLGHLESSCCMDGCPFNHWIGIEVVRIGMRPGLPVLLQFLQHLRLQGKQHAMPTETLLDSMHLSPWSAIREVQVAIHKPQLVRDRRNLSATQGGYEVRSQNSAGG